MKPKAHVGPRKVISIQEAARRLGWTVDKVRASRFSDDPDWVAEADLPVFALLRNGDPIMRSSNLELLRRVVENDPESLQIRRVTE